MKNSLLSFFFLMLVINTVSAQTGNVGIGTNTPDAAAKLDINSTNSGLLLPRLSPSDKNTIATPIPAGLVIYNTTTTCIEVYNGTGWQTINFNGIALSGITMSAPVYAFVNFNATVAYTVPSVSSQTYLWSATKVSGSGTATISNGTTNSATITYGGAQGSTTIWTIAVGINNCVGTLNVSNTVQAGGSNIFTATGASQSFFDATYGVTSAMVKLWGAGGGGSNYSANQGGGGAFVSGTLTVTAATVYTFIVGAGGAVSTATTYGGGGGGLSGWAGSGGGRSAIQLTAGVDLITAGGGGGGSYYKTANYGHGGGGGAVNGANGIRGYNTGTCNAVEIGGGGNNGTSTGAAGNGVTCGNTSYNGGAGTKYTGGTGNGYGSNPGGGGGGGYYGGGGGASYYGGGGGGGSSYVSGTGFTLTTNTVGTTMAVIVTSGDAASGGYGDSDKPATPGATPIGDGGGGVSSANYGSGYKKGGDGSIVIKW